jgi:hypothetical protein
MAMKREDHENLLNELLLPDIEQSRKTEILQLLRTDYGVVLADEDNFKKTTEKLTKDNQDLIISNSQLFRQIGVLGGDEKTKQKQDDKSFSETITLESLEKQVH